MAELFRNSVLSVAATLAGMTSGFIVTALVARTLGPEGAGVVALVVWLSMSATGVAGFGRPQVILKYVPGLEDGPASRLTTAAFLQGLPLALLICGGLVLFALVAPQLSGETEAHLLVAGSVFFLAYFLFVYATAAAQGRGRFGETATTTVLGSALQVPFAVAGGLLAGPAGAIAGMALRYLPQGLLIVRYLRRGTGKLLELPSGAGRYGLQIWLTDMIDLLALSRVELLVLGLFWRPEDVGFFAVAIAFFGIVGQISLQLSSVFIVGFSKPVPPTEGVADDQGYGLALKLLALFMVPVSFGGAALMPVFLPLVFGQEFLPAVPASMVLMASSAWAAVAVVPWSYLAARGESRRLLNLMIMLAILSTAALLVLVPVFGVIGAAWARALGEAAFLGLLVRAVHRRSGPALPLAGLCRITAAGLCCGLAALACVLVLPGLPGLAAAIVFGAVVYLGVLRLMPVFSGAERALIDTGLEQKLPQRWKSLCLRLSAAVFGPV